MLRTFVEQKHYKFAGEAKDWKDAIRMSCESLEADGTVEANYKEDRMDKYFLLTYTMNGKDGFRHSYHAWFETEKELRAFAAEKEGLEVDLAIQIVSCREIDLSYKEA